MNTALTTITAGSGVGDGCAPDRGRGGRRSLLERGAVRPTRPGFTLTEMLIVIAIIAILAALTLVAMSSALSTSKRAATQGLLNMMGSALEAYHADLGEYPPLVTGLGEPDEYGTQGPSAIETPGVLGVQARLNNGNARDAVNDAYKDARFYSEWTIGVFLLGAGDVNGDKDQEQGWWEDTSGDGKTNGDDNIYDDGTVGFGFRNPGKDPGAWKKIEGTELVHSPQLKGNTFGPYLDPGSTDRFIERVAVEYDGTAKRIVPQANPSSDPTERQVMYRFVDSWGSPIRYYKNWLTRDPTTRETSELFSPVELRSYELYETWYERDGSITVSDGYITRAPFMLLSAGAEPISVEDQIEGARHVVAPFGDVLQSSFDDDGDTDTPEQLIKKLVQPSFMAPFDFASFDALTPLEQEDLLDMIRTNLRYAP